MSEFLLTMNGSLDRIKKKSDKYESNQTEKENLTKVNMYLYIAVLALQILTHWLSSDPSTLRQ